MNFYAETFSFLWKFSSRGDVEESFSSLFGADLNLEALLLMQIKRWGRRASAARRSFTSSPMRSERERDACKHLLLIFLIQSYFYFFIFWGRFRNWFMCRKHVESADQWRRSRNIPLILFLLSFCVSEAFSVPNVFIVYLLLSFLRLPTAFPF